MKVIQINGIKGLITALFIGVCLFAGFVLFPGYTAMTMWNKYLATNLMFPVLNLLQGVLLWAIIAITFCIVSKQELAVSLKSTPNLTDEELDSIIKKAKTNAQMKMMNKIISQSDKFELQKDEKHTSSVIEKDSFMSSPISINNKNEQNDEESVSNIK
ncbi:MAG: hypothetical protein K2F57_01275 [Candidatus Gastranaerophilales bacterium]|nr:hypothetical protein [Candidatus Gastranaerophilales bacterium]